MPIVRSATLLRAAIAFLSACVAQPAIAAVAEKGKIELELIYDGKTLRETGDQVAILKALVGLPPGADRAVIA